MGFLDAFRRPALTEALDRATALGNQLEVVEATMRDVSLQQEDRGWARLGGDEDAFSQAALLSAAKDGRVLAVAHPLVRRGLALRGAFVHGDGGPQVTVTTDSEQDANTVVQAWWEARENRGALTGPEARTRLDRSLSTDGNVFIACFTNPRTGVVVNRTIPFDEITEIVTNPDDRLEVWFYKREWTQKVPVDAGESLTMRDETRTAYYPDLAFAPSARPRRVNGTEVRWGEPVRHVRVNDLDGWLYGLGDTYAIAPYARAYRDFIGDWAKYMRSLSQFAWRLTADGKRQQRARQALAHAAEPGSSIVQGVGESLEAIPKTGATIDADSGRPLLAMVAAGLDVPVTMLSTDPGVTGARAVAETLDGPMYRTIHARRDVWAQVYVDIAEYVIEQSIRAPQGALRGEIVVDPWTRTDHAELDGAAPVVAVSWPDLSTESMESRVNAIAVAGASRTVPPRVLAREFLVALGVPDLDDVMDELTDDAGQWRDPYAALGSQLVAAFQRGEDPAQALGQYGRFGTDSAAAREAIREAQ